MIVSASAWAIGFCFVSVSVTMLYRHSGNHTPDISVKWNKIASYIASLRIEKPNRAFELMNGILPQHPEIAKGYAPKEPHPR